MIVVLAILLAGALLWKPTKAAAPNLPNEDGNYNGIIIQNGAITRPEIGYFNTKLFTSRPTQSSGRHSIRAEKEVSEQNLRVWLSKHESPLEPYSEQLAKSPYSSTIIGICTIEQYSCTKAPFNNYWGIFCGKALCRYDSIPNGIQAANDLLDKMYNNGHTTVESLNCYYVVPCSSNWLNTVLATKQTLENL